MTNWITRAGNSLMVEIPETLAQEAGLGEGQAIEWIADGGNSLAIVKKTVADGLLEI